MCTSLGHLKHLLTVYIRNHKPTESDLEDDDEDDEDDDPSTWFEDDQDDGRKGQMIVEPDVDDFSDIIRIDENKMRYGSFYEPHDEGDWMNEKVYEITVIKWL